MKDLTKPITNQRPPIVLSEKAKEQEIWHKLVVKVIRWQGNLSTTDKITPKEWAIYSKSYLEINTSSDRTKNLSKLAETKKLIIAHGGLDN